MQYKHNSTVCLAGKNEIAVYGLHLLMKYVNKNKILVVYLVGYRAGVGTEIICRGGNNTFCQIYCGDESCMDISCVTKQEATCAFFKFCYNVLFVFVFNIHLNLCWWQ